MSSKDMREEVNVYLRDVITAARESLGLNIKQAAIVTGLTEIEYLTVETLPSVISIEILDRVMRTFGKSRELEAANYGITAPFLGYAVERQAKALPEMRTPALA